MRFCSRFSAALIFFSTLLFSPAISFAQTHYVPIRESIFRDFFEQGMAEGFRRGSPQSWQDTFAGHDKIEGLENLSEPVDDYTCPDGSCTAGATSSEYLEGTNVSYPIAAMVPPTFGSVSDLLWSPSKTKQINEQMSAATVVQRAAIALTEPAVMAGLDSAIKEASDNHQSDLLSGIQLGALALQMPGSREAVKTYLNCMQTRYGKVGLSFSEARASCLRDTTLPSSRALVQGQPDIAAVTNMDMGDSPAKQAENPAAALEDIPKGRLTELLFNEHIYAKIPGTVSHASVRRLKEDFQKYYGDIEYTVEEDGLVDPDFIGPVLPTNRLVSKTKQILPTWLPADLLRLRTHERWDTMRVNLYAYCDWYNKHQNTVAVNDGATDEMPVNYWGDAFDAFGPYKISPKLMRDLSAPGYAFSSQEFDILFKEIEYEPRFKNDCSLYFGDSAKVLPYCPFNVNAAGFCDPPLPPVSFQPLVLPARWRVPFTAVGGGKPVPIWKYIETVVHPNFEEKSPRLFRKMNFLATFLSRMQILQEGVSAISMLNHFVGDDPNVSSNSLVSDAQRLVLKSLNTDDPLRSLEQARVQLERYVANAKRELDQVGIKAVQAAGQIPNNK